MFKHLIITLNMYLFTAILMAERINPNSINMFKGNETVIDFFIRKAELVSTSF